ncbi:hypothetical protein LEMLEM_LOCUS8050, partial [Lemmus lemmus]
PSPAPSPAGRPEPRGCHLDVRLLRCRGPVPRAASPTRCPSGKDICVNNPRKPLQENSPPTTTIDVRFGPETTRSKLSLVEMDCPALRKDAPFPSHQ